MNPCPLLIVAASVFVGGCAVAPPNYMVPPGDVSARSMTAEAAPAALTESLFPQDAQVLGNEAIRQILDSPVYVAKPARLAVLRFGQLPAWWTYSEEFARTSDRIDADFLDTLRGSDRLGRVAYLPTMMMPNRQTIPYLREAAVRFQCDLLLVYRTTTGNYVNNRLFGADEVRAYCTVEGVLIDVRTGTIPFSSIVTDRFEAKKSSDDKDFAETVTKATQRAIGRAWVRLAADTAAYLKDAPAAPQAGGFGAEDDGEPAAGGGSGLGSPH